MLLDGIVYHHSTPRISSAFGLKRSYHDVEEDEDKEQPLKKVKTDIDKEQNAREEAPFNGIPVREPEVDECYRGRILEHKLPVPTPKQEPICATIATPNATPAPHRSRILPTKEKTLTRVGRPTPNHSRLLRWTWRATIWWMVTVVSSWGYKPITHAVEKIG